MVSVDVGPWGGLYPDDRAAIADLTALLVRIATGFVDEDMARSYNRLRNELLGNPEYADIIPRALREARTAGQFQAVVNRQVKADQEAASHVMTLVQELAQRAYQLSGPEGSVSSRVTEDGTPRRTEDGSVRVTEDGDAFQTEDGGPLLTEDGSPLQMEGQPDIVEAVGTAVGVGRAQAEGVAALNSEAWTGRITRSQRLIGLRAELGVAQLAVEELIAGLADEGGNGGPLLDEHQEALETLRELHQKLGQLLAAIDRGVLTDELGDTLAADIFRFGARAVGMLRADRAKFTLALASFAVLSACGAGDWAGFISSAALQVPKRAKN